MKLLLDESVPKQIGLPMPVLVLLARRTRVKELRPLVPRVVDVVTGPLRRRVYHIAE